jgi:hypothetical protein
MGRIKGQRNIDGDVQEYIVNQIKVNWTAAQIENGLNEKYKNTPRFKKLPSTRTIQQMVKEKKIIDNSGIWSIDDSNPEDARLVLDILADSFARRYGEPISKGIAQWIIRVKKAAPDAPPKIVYFLAILYFSHEISEDIDVTSLTNYLAYAPWKIEKENYRLYKRAVLKKWITKVPLWPILIDELSTKSLTDLRFSSNVEAIEEFENEIRDSVKAGSPIKYIVEKFDIHPDDVEDILEKKGQNEQ